MTWTNTSGPEVDTDEDNEDERKEDQDETTEATESSAFRPFTVAIDGTITAWATSAHEAREVAQNVLDIARDKFTQYSPKLTVQDVEEVVLTKTVTIVAELGRGDSTHSDEEIVRQFRRAIEAGSSYGHFNKPVGNPQITVATARP